MPLMEWIFPCRRKHAQIAEQAAQEANKRAQKATLSVARKLGPSSDKRFRIIIEAAGQADAFFNHEPGR